MTLENMIYASFEFAVLVPLVLLCILPIKEHCIIKSKALIPVTTAVLIVLSIILGVIKVILYVRPKFIFAPFLALFFVFYITFFKVAKLKLWYLFSSMVAKLTFIFSFSLLVEAIFNNTSKRENVITASGLITEWCITILIYVLFLIWNPKIKRLIKTHYITSIWRVLWFVPFLTTLANMFMMPVQYSDHGLIEIETIYIVLVLFVLYMLFQALLYNISKAFGDKRKAEKESHIASTQAMQYRSLKKYIEDTSRMRHDFLHTARTAVTLAQNNEIDTLVKFLEDYGVSVEESHSRKIFCEHDALNAIIAYYYDMVKKQDIKCIWQIAIPNNIGISDVDLCSVVGNLLNNAIQGALTAPEGKRYITFKADVELNDDIYMVISNSFDGVINKENGKYFTTKDTGHGIGLDSIKTTVKNYNGYANFYNDNENFYTDIMMKQNK